MKKKQSSSEMLNIIVVWCISFMVCVAIVVVYYSNSQKDSCLSNPELKECICDENKITYTQSHNSTSDFMLSSSKHTLHNKMCTSYNYTLLDKSNNSSNEGTITEITICDTCFGFCETSTIINYTIKTSYCVRAHSPKTECEKGNSNYVVEEVCPIISNEVNINPYQSILVYGGEGYVNNESSCCYPLLDQKDFAYCGVSDRLYPSERVCRHKFLDEYSCEELKEHLKLVGEKYCFDSGWWDSEIKYSLFGTYCSSKWKVVQEDVKMNLFYYKKCGELI